MNTWFESGNFNAICDRCGFQFKASELRRDWQGFMVDKKCFESRHPQDFIKLTQERVGLPWSRPEDGCGDGDTNTTKDFCYLEEKQALPNIGVASCMIANETDSLFRDNWGSATDGTAGTVITPMYYNDIPASTATFLLRYDHTTDIRWENVVTTGPTPEYQDTYSPSIGKITADAADQLFGIYSADMNTGITTRSGSWDNGGCFLAPAWPTTGDFTAEVFVKIHSANSTPNNIKGGWIFNSGGLGHAFIDPNSYTAYQNKGANSVYVTNLGAVQLSQGNGQDTTNDPLRLTLLTGDGTVVTDSWTHLAFVRSGTTWKIFSGPVGGIGQLRVSGVEQHVSTSNSNPYLGSGWSQARPTPNTGCFIGNLIEYRTCNVALYSGTQYLVPEGPLLVNSPTLVFSN